MVELRSESPCEGMLPIAMGSATLSEVDPGVMTSLSPFAWAGDAMAEALKTAHGMAWPRPNRATGKEGARAIWFGRAHILLVGPSPDAALAAHGALTDQSDAWAVVRLEGDDAVDVLARLVPVDLRASAFRRGFTVRTQLQHMTTSITRVGERAFQIMVFRSMSATLVHDLKTAMEGVAARR
ncbi:MAG: sarcosine oxidase subunit gamma [Pseudomonadota bacterium]